MERCEKRERERPPKSTNFRDASKMSKEARWRKSHRPYDREQVYNDRVFPTTEYFADRQRSPTRAHSRRINVEVGDTVVAVPRPLRRPVESDALEVELWIRTSQPIARSQNAFR